MLADAKIALKAKLHAPKHHAYPRDYSSPVAELTRGANPATCFFMSFIEGYLAIPVHLILEGNDSLTKVTHVPGYIHFLPFYQHQAVLGTSA